MRMKRHVRSFVKGATGEASWTGAELVPTPADVMAKATRMLQRVMSLQLVWFLCFSVGGVLAVWTAWKNTHLPASCTVLNPLLQHASSTTAADCAKHSYLWPLVLMLVGITGLLVTGYVATRLAVKYLGAGAAAFLRSGRRFVGPMGPKMSAQNMGAWFPGSSGGVPPEVKGGLPPGTPGSPSGPPVGGTGG